MKRGYSIGLVMVLGLVGACGSSSENHADAALDMEPSETGGETINSACGAPVPSLTLACSAYCSDLAANCVGANAQFASDDACLTACTAPSWSCGSPGDQTGNTVLCRDGHAVAAETSPATECAQAGPNSATCI